MINIIIKSILALIVMISFCIYFISKNDKVKTIAFIIEMLAVIAQLIFRWLI